MQIENGKIVLSSQRKDNMMNLNNTDYYFSRLQPDKDGNKGANSALFTIRNLSNETDEVKVIKICRFPFNNSQNDNKNIRFNREIDALKKSKGKSYIINYYFDGKIKIQEKEYRYYVMEKAETDLKDFVLLNKPDIQTKVSICKQIINSFVELFDLKIYHRDIKPDNFLYVENTMKIGDLGLIKYRDEDYCSIDKYNEFIGPRGWSSPETMNKVLNAKNNGENNFDCKIDYQSDIFQLGKLFWFIFQGNVPIGRIKRNDFKNANDDIYRNIVWMLNHSKSRRPIDINQLLKEFIPIFKNYAA